MSTLFFECRTRLPSYVSVHDLERAGKKLAQALTLPTHSSITVQCVSLSEMTRINSEQRGKPVPTDVLSFAVAEEVQLLTPKQLLRDLGDVIICPVYAAREARRRGVDVREEFIRLLVHGVLHIRGYDHGTESEEYRMFSLQERLVSSICSSST